MTNRPTTRRGPVPDLLGRRATEILARSVAGRKVQRRVSSVLGKTQFPMRAAAAPKGIETRLAAKRVGADFPTGWARTPQAQAARVAIIETILRPTVAGLASPTRLNTDRLTDLNGPAIFIANHHSHLDTSLLLTSIPRPWRHEMVVGAAADYFFGTRLTGALSALAIGAIPIERLKVERKSADLAAELITEGWSLLIFPEGGRSTDGWGQPFRGGAAYLTLKTGVPIVPVYAQGTRKVLRKGSLRPRRSSTTVNFGRPIWPTEGESSRQLNRRVEQAVAVLGDELHQGWYEARRRAHADETPGMGGPKAASWRRSWALDESKAGTRQRERWPHF